MTLNSSGQVKEGNCSSISSEVSERALEIMNDYRFVIKASYLEVHPRDAYLKLCNYLQVKDRPLTQYFSKVRFSAAPICNSFTLVSLLSRARELTLVTDQLKLRQL